MIFTPIWATPVEGVLADTTHIFGPIRDRANALGLVPRLLAIIGDGIFC